ncbi:glycosyltransferase family 2 protein [candidate division KSB1 bacterium]|nr:glycosyltransferase family 2 protein [candidate division KSB1 bacterium]RQW06903.1 MAG: glycosyltransferase family 2 protein [candidate division KSB1 bacterium]
MTKTQPCPRCGYSDPAQPAFRTVLHDDRQVDYTAVKLSVVVPVYNEKNTIRKIIQRIQNVELNKEIIIVDDYSTDGTRDMLPEISREYDNIKLILHDHNQGKGAALRTGFQHVAGDIVIIQDADLEYNPNEYYKLIYPIVADLADVVYGSRFIGETHRVLFFWHYVGNRFLTMLSNMFTNLNLTDMETCYKIFRRQVLEDIDIKSNRFGFEPEITAKVAKKRCRIYEMPIQYHGRDYSEGKKIGWRDGVNAIWSILRFNLFR